MLCTKDILFFLHTCAESDQNSASKLFKSKKTSVAAME